MIDEAKVERLVRALERALERLEAPEGDVILTRDQAAKQLKVSTRQLQRLVSAGRILAHPSGIARVELERYAKTPQAKLPQLVSRPMRERAAKDEADRLEALLSTRRKRR